MKREIKFRAWDGNKMHYPDDFGISGNTIGWLWDWDSYRLYSDDFMQYTELKDKNGKEIYEGDIVYSDQWNPTTYQVYFNRGGFCFGNEGDAYLSDCKYLEDFEVIGNIYENPELLK